MTSRLRDYTRVSPAVYTGSMIVEDLKKKCRASILHDSTNLSNLMVHVHQVEESRKRKHDREGNMSRQAEENFSTKRCTEIMG